MFHEDARLRRPRPSPDWVESRLLGGSEGIEEVEEVLGERNSGDEREQSENNERAPHDVVSFSIFTGLRPSPLTDGPLYY